MTPDVTTTARPGTYRIDPRRTTVHLTATHFLGLKPVDATLTVRSGTLMIAADPEHSTVSAELDATSFTTDDKRRDKDVLGHRFLATDSHPVISFRSTAVTRTPEGWQLTGILALRGGSAPINLHLTEAVPVADGYRFTATTTIDRIAAGVTAGRGLIARHVKVRIECVATAG
ncbi:YceI family protein [Actinoplanes friuliensis]|uniref:YceI family protein n=1 Tax=Actinoplanes friuliensis TaxID=196914 RepID=UPI0005A1577A|nr:YceI family protein [Actinoplanes friuliensis]